MATLPTEDTNRIWRGLMRYWSSVLHGETLAGITKSDLSAAVVATDAWIDANQVSFNNALPQPFKGNATLAQKTLLFCAVALMRVSLGALKSLFSEVD
jgi:hypothetical protein